MKSHNMRLQRDAAKRRAPEACRSALRGYGLMRASITGWRIFKRADPMHEKAHEDSGING